MGLFDRLFRSRRPRLAKLPTEIAVLDAGPVNVRMAEELLIVTLAPQGAKAVRVAVDKHSACQLVDARPVAWVPVSKPTRPVLDPRLGWILPIDPELATQLSTTLSPAPGGYEIGEWLAIVVED